MEAAVVVVGGGVIGCAIARELARRSVPVTVIERDEPGAHASRAAAGMLSPLAEADQPDEFLRLLLAARTRYPELASALLSETGVDVEYRAEGTLLVSTREADDAVLDRRWRWQADSGLAVERLTAAEARRLEPALTPRARCALRFPDDHQVDNRRLTHALHASALAHGAEFLTGREVAEIVVEGGRAVGVRTRSGRRIPARAVVLATGCWAGQMMGLPRDVPVEPVHGQLISLDASSLGIGHVVDTPRVYLVPRRDGRLIAGATVERTGFTTEPTAEVTAELRAAAEEAVPALADAALLDAWSGLRPGTPDDRPIIGADPDVDDLVYATGHYRNGILLAPITAEAVAALVTGGRAPAEVEPFGIERLTVQNPR